jgi:hypothetical protein
VELERDGLQSLATFLGFGGTMCSCSIVVVNEIVRVILTAEEPSVTLHRIDNPKVDKVSLAFTMSTGTSFLNSGNFLL